MVSGMGTSRALFKGLSPLVNISAVDTAPGNLLIPGEHLALFDITLKGQVALLVLSFSYRNGFEDQGDLRAFEDPRE